MFFLPFFSTPICSFIVHMLVCLTVLQGHWGSVNFTPLIFHYYLQTEQSQLTYLYPHAFYLPPALICYWDSLLNFPFQFFYFLTPEFSFGSISHFLSTDVLYLMKHCSHTSFYSLYMFSFSCLNIFHVLDLK